MTRPGIKFFLTNIGQLFAKIINAQYRSLTYPRLCLVATV